jgi:hypothetical protein
MKERHLNKEEIQNKYRNHRKLLNFAQGVDVFGSLTGTVASLAANFATDDPKYVMYGVGSAVLGFLGYQGLEYIRTRINPAREQKEISKLEKQINKDIPLIVENPEMLKTKYSKSVPLNIGRN